MMVLATSLLAAAVGGFPSYFSWCDWDVLAERIGVDDVPTGEDVMVGQVEAEQNGNYMPDESLSDFSKKFILERSGSSGPSSHATNVARKFYGNEESLAPGVWLVNCWEVNDWLQNGFLHAGQGSANPPEYTGFGNIKVWNHSWVGSLGQSTDRDALRRIDWVIEKDENQPVVCVGLNNGSTPQPLLSWSYNTIAVGRLDGDHAIDAPSGGIDGMHRHACDIVGPQFTTSEACAVVAASAAMLVEQSGLDIEDLPAEVVKAIMMAAADHRGPSDGSGTPWGNNADSSGARRGRASEPLDPVMGAGQINVNRAHLVMGGGDQPGGADPATAPAVTTAGWAFEDMAPGDDRYWLVEATGHIDTMSVLLTWNRTVADSFTSFTLADLDLELLRIDPDSGIPMSLVGDPGIPVFSEGTVRSVAVDDNVEHLYLKGLAPGRYLLQITRTDDDGQAEAAIAWHMDDPVVDPDLSHDGVVDVPDLLGLLTHWGPCDLCRADLEGSGVVDLQDLILLLNTWTP